MARTQNEGHPIERLVFRGAIAEGDFLKLDMAGEGFDRAFGDPRCL